MNEKTTNGDHKNELKHLEDDEETKASIKIWDYVFGFTDMALIKCAIDLKIPDILEKHGGSISLHELSTSLVCPTSTNLDRIVKYLIQRKIFKLTKSTQNDYIFAQTALSKRLLTNGKNTIAPLFLLECSPTMLAPWLGLSDRVIGKSKSAFDDAHGVDVWSFASKNRVHSKLINDAMACDARVVIPQIIKECPKLFDGVTYVVDVGGGDGTTIGLLVKGYPWIKGINFDVPHVIEGSTLACDGVEHVGGNMFDLVPQADVAIMKWVLHDWGDEECIEILRKCKEAIPKDNGKIIILEAVLEEVTEDKLDDARLMFDMVMMAHTTNGKERTLKQWTHVLNTAGFSRVVVTPIHHAVQSVIEAHP